MIGIVVLTHGKFAEGISDSLRMIVGKQENFAFLGLKENQSLESFKENVTEVIKSVSNGSGVIIFVDMFGATPFNAVSMVRKDLISENIDVLLHTGVNLPVLLEAVTTREGNSLDDLSNQLVIAGKESIESLDLR